MSSEVLVFPIGFAQQRLWFLDQMTPGLTAYAVTCPITLTGPLDRRALERTLEEIVRRHEALRTTFDVVDGRPVQVVDDGCSLPCAFVDLTRMSARRRDEASARIAAAEANQPFDLRRGPLVRARLISLAAGEHLLLLTIHHIVTDGWSTRILEREVMAVYAAFRRGKRSPLPEVTVQYADFAAWQRRRLAGPGFDSHRAWWRAALRGAPAVLDLPADRARPAVHRFQGASLRFWIPARVVTELEHLCHESRATLFMGALAAFFALLHRYTGLDDIVVGTPVAGRAHPALEHVVGFFVNTVIVRIDLSGDPPYQELLARVREASLNAYAHDEIPFEQLVADLAPDRRLSHMPLVQAMFTLDAADVIGVTPHGGPRDLGEQADLEVEAPEPGTAKFDLTMALGAAPDGLHGTLEFNTDLFDESTAVWLVRHYHALLTAAVNEPGRPLSALSMLANGERELLLSQWSGTRTNYPADQSVQAVFAAVTARRRDGVAVADGERSISYGELASRAQRLANRLRALGVVRGTLVGVCAERSLEFVVAVLAVLQAGGAYVPLDPSYPPRRLRFMIEDTEVPVILTTEEFAGQFADLSPVIVLLDSGDVGADTPVDVAARPVENAPDDLAYVMYTSGSSGEPKGVMVPHRAILRLVLATDYIALEPEDVVAHASNVSFDAATFEIWGALLNGARLVVIPRDVALSPHDFARRLTQERVTVMFVTTPLFHQLAVDIPDAFAGVRHLLFGGDVADPRLVRAVVRASAPPGRLLHVYGPTESTTFATWHLVNDVPDGAASVPIGRPLANTEVYILDGGGAVVPVGLPGELHIGGDGLAHGYLGRPEATAACFVPHPFRADPSARLYRTGDLVRRRPDGAIEFVGRIDGQVKIRGFRVEPGEVEVVLGSAPGVREIAVVPREMEHGGRQLVAHVAGNWNGTPPTAVLRRYAREHLPDYMVPVAFVLVDELPRTENGKIDRRALRESPLQPAAETENHVAPRSDVERTIAGIWRETLQLERVGIHDNFFDVGGHSLLLIRVLDRLRQVLPGELTMLDLFHYPTVAALADHIRRGAVEIGSASLAADAPRDGDWESTVTSRAALLREALARRVQGESREPNET